MNQLRSASRPTGITIIATLMVVFAIAGTCGALARLGFAPLAFFDAGLGGIFSQATGAMWAVILAVANISLAFGLFGLRRWAYFATIIIEVIALTSSGFGGLGAPRLACGYHLIPLLVIIYMLIDGNVRRAFRI